MNLNSKRNRVYSVADNPMTLHKNLEFTATEQYKILRTNLSFLLTENGKCNVIGVTSSMRGEGKSTTAINLSYVIAESGKRVLLIDGDLRLPTIAKKMKIDNKVGLTNFLKGGETINMSSFSSSQGKDWYIVPSGDLPPNPSELLGSVRMEKVLNQLKEMFDYIIIDLPPVNVVADALAISKYLDGMILVVRENYTAKKEFETCFRQLKISNVKVLGCVMNGAKESMGKYKYRGSKKYKKEYGYGYGYGKNTNNQ